MGRRILLVSALVVVLVSATTADDNKLDKKKTVSWVEWVNDKVKQGIGFTKEQPIDDTGKLNKHTIEELVTGGKQIPLDWAGAKDKAYAAANEVYNKADEKAQQAKQAASETTKQASYKAASMKDAAIDKAQKFVKQASIKTCIVKDKSKQKAEAAEHTIDDVREHMAQKTGEAKEKANRNVETKEKADQWAEEDQEEEKSTSWVKEKAKEGYEGVKERASRTLHNAKKMAKDMVNPQYDDDEL